MLVVAKDEAHHLAECLAAARWADERVVVVDSRSRDATLEIARREADVVAVRAFDDFAGQRNAALALASGDWVLAVDADERVTPALAAEIRRVIADGASPYRGFRVPIRSEILGRRFAFSGTQHDRPLRLFRRDCGRWVGPVHETVALRGPAGSVRNPLRHRTIPTMRAFLDKINDYTTLEAEGLAGSRRPYRGRDLVLRPLWIFFKLYVLKQGFRDGAEGFMFCMLSGVSAAVRAWKHRELARGGWRVARGASRSIPSPHAPRPTPYDPQADYEAIVASRFDALHGRFKRELADDDPRLLGIVEGLRPLAGRRVLDLGCGKGRFARALRDRGARVVGLDLSAAMLAAADGVGLDRVRGSARRLPFGAASFDRVVAVEVFEHLPPRALDAVCGEVHRVLRPGGIFVIVDKNVYSVSARRRWLPNLAVKWIDQRRGRWMYSHREPVRERWFRPGGLRRRLRRWFPEVRVVHLLSRFEEGRFPFRQVPAARLLVLWAARAPGGAA